MSISYKDSGVDVQKGEELVDKIKAKVKSTYNSRVYEGVGGFACLYESTPEKLLAAGTDGVGTKLMLAQHLNIHNTIGIDLVAMCVNDVLCTGARPLFFMDYLACGVLDLAVTEQIIEGVIEGCKESECALIGGETAEMPGMYHEGEYDLAGFCVGEVDKTHLIDGKNISSGDTLIGLPSTGIHSNGLSLARKIVSLSETELVQELLTPTKIYWNDLKELLKVKDLVSGLSHVTGGGIDNIPRMNKRFTYLLDQWPTLDSMPSIYTVLKERSKLSDLDFLKTFNCGIGLVIATSRPDDVFKILKSQKTDYQVIGLVEDFDETAGNIRLNCKL
jgi:phosphoribosylformylglycinamidine cyclo-ligase